MTSRRKVGDERLYYTPPAMRRYKQQQQQQQKQQKSKSSSVSSLERRGLESDSNLDRFLEHTTPSVSAQHFPWTSVHSWRNCNHEFHPYFFILGDLWESFREWSVYGAGVPLVLNGTDSVVQYYVPFLSGIQLYVDPSRNVVERRPGEDSDANSSGSDGENECRPERGTGTSNHTELLFEYFERELPFHREPLADKISILASHFPLLKTHRSCDLTPASWISISWYPIYRIPVGPTLQNVDTCFLTYHSLAKPIMSSDGGRDCGSKLSLPTFGLVPYKFKVSDWNHQNGVQEGQKMSSLLQDADNWLRVLQVNHPDYSFFTTRGTSWR
ncbi:uncharacterized protein LOC127266631 [Andrographis paniculata]|uniref:uncharacterized protein LOC127266631 n=1 Tax=Andrographis paniculata TaxID=175694 RepID=UPI0021E8E37D|nr:uncharacterized protein LOC127266631 [Andrographis paniculata]